MNTKSTMAPLLLVSAAALAMAVAPARGEGLSSTGPDRMVHAMQLDKSVLVGMQLAMRRAAAEGKVSTKTYECVKAVDSSFFTHGIAQAIAPQMTHDEIAEATMFFEGPVGKKYSQYGLFQLYKDKGFPLKEPAPRFSREEYEELTRFSKTSVGQKLLVQHAAESSSVRNLLVPKIQDVLRRCSGKGR